MVFFIYCKTSNISINVTGAHSWQACSCAGSVCMQDIFCQGFVFCQLTLCQLDRITAHCSFVVLLKNVL